MQKHISEKRHAVNKPEQQQGTAICVIHRSFYTGITNLSGHTRDDDVLLQEAGGQGKERPTFARATVTSNKETLSLEKTMSSANLSVPAPTPRHLSSYAKVT